MQKLVLENHKLVKDENETTISGLVDGNELYFITPNTQEINLTAEPFIAAMLMPAMQRGFDILVPDDLTASSAFICNLQKLQEIFVAWYPSLSKIEINVKIADNGSGSKNSETAAFFSGGIDAVYSLIKFAPEISKLIYVRGIDMQLTDDVLWGQCLFKNREVANKFGKSLVTVETNVRFFIRKLSNPEISWTISQGCGLASIAHLLGFANTHISASNTYKSLHPFGSHPLTDPLFSSNNVKIIHSGCEASRHEKLLEISKDEFLLSRLRVCWQDNGFNCGQCDKCLHFRMALHLLNLNGGELQPLSDFRELSAAHTGTLGEFIEWEDNLILAEFLNNEKAIKALRKILKRYKRKELLRQIDEIYFDKKISNLVFKFRK